MREPHKDGGAKFQPLRSQQLQQLKGGATSPTRNRLRDEHKEEAQPSSSSEGSSAQLALTAGDGASADSSSSDGSVSVSSSAALLFEDTLVISGRPVLVRVSELSSPARLEVRVFDPYSSLEYDLSLPLTFVRMCMYQVPDLLLQHNRKYLVQTLLHYLVFVQTDAQATGNAGAGGLELLVDIVAPPPRNAVEAAAWARVQEEAAIEQASWELDNEREAARARRELQRQQSHSQAQEQKAQEQTAQTEQETDQNEQEQQPEQQSEESDELTQSTEAQSTAAADGTEQPAGAATTAADEPTAPSNDSSVAEAVSDAALTDSADAASSADSAQPAAASSSSSSSSDAIDK